MAGLVGALALTAIHETARRVVPHAPRTDVLGSRAVAAAFRWAGLTPPGRDGLYALAMAADISSNGAIYAAIPLGDGRTIYRRGLVIGLLTGLTAWLLPPAVGLGHMPGRRTPHTQLMTLAWYTAGGLAAAWAGRGRFDRRSWFDAGLASILPPPTFPIGFEPRSSRWPPA